MASVAKITYGPLIDHLKESSEVYQQIFQQYSMKYGTIDKNVFSSWMVSAVEPIIISCTQNQPSTLRSLFKTLYIASLEIIGNGSALQYEQEYVQVWKLYGLIPNLIQRSSSEIVNALHGALESLRKYRPQQVMTWISGMKDSVQGCVSVGDVLACGRINAWLCGMAHLRSKAISSYLLLPEKVQQDLLRLFPSKADFISLAASPWIGLKKPQFIGEAGGFIGIGGNFKAPPIAAVVQQQLVITDGTNTNALFADSLGMILLSEVPVPAGIVIQQSTVKGLEKFKQKNKHLVPFDDASSCAEGDCTFVITRKTSHFIYVYGWSA